jgi:hypothetical protein
MADNPLVAQAPAEGSGFTKGTGDNGWVSGISIAESAMDTFNGFKDGSWVEAGLGMVGLAADAASMAIDPFGTLMSSAASFLMEHMQPLKDMLDWLAGDPPVIQSYSTTWNNVSTELGKIGEDYNAALKSGTEGWSGPAAEAYRQSATEHSDALSGAASAAGSVGTVVGIMGMVVGFVREMVRDLIADLVGKLISWVLEAVFSLGFGTPVIVAQAITAISKWAAKIAKLVQKLLDTIKRVAPMLKKLVEVFEKIMKVLGKIAGKVSGLDVLGKKIDDPGFLKKLNNNGSPDLPSGRGHGNGDSSPDGSPDSPDRPGRGDSADNPTDSNSPNQPTSRPNDTTTTSSTTTPDTADPGAPRPDRGDPSGRVPEGETRGGPRPDPDAPPANAPQPGSAAPRPGSPTPHTPAAGDSSPSPRSTSNSPGGAPSNPTHSTAPSGPSGQTHSSSAAPPEAPPRRPDQPHTPTRDTSPSNTAPQGAPSAGGAPHGPSGGGSTPNAGSPRPGSGGGWTGTSGTRGDLGSGAPNARTPDAPGTSRAQSAAPSTGTPHQSTPNGFGPGTRGGPPQGGLPQSGPPHAGPPSARPPQAGPPHAGPPQQRPHTGPPNAGPPQPRGPQHTRPEGAPPGAPRPGGSPDAPNRPAPHDRGAPQHDPSGPRDRGDAGPAHDRTDPGHHDAQHEPRPDVDEAHARHGETTPAGVSHHRGDPDMGDLPQRVPNDPRYFTADVHITPDGRARIGNHSYSPEEYGDLLRRNGWDGKTPIRLIGCDAGSNDFARRLSAHTDAPVLAPNKPAWTDSQGRVFTSDAEVDAHGNRQPKVPPNGEWETHHPDGTKTKAGNDGYVPGTPDSHRTGHNDADGAVDRASPTPPSLPNYQGNFHQDSQDIVNALNNAGRPDLAQKYQDLVNRQMNGGNVGGLEDWMDETAPRARAGDPDQVLDKAAELTELDRLSGEIGHDPDLSVRFNPGVSGSRSFDILVERTTNGVTTIERRVEIERMKDLPTVSSGMHGPALHGADKATAPTPGRVPTAETSVVMPTPPANGHTVPLGGGNERRIDSNGLDYEIVDPNGNVRKSGNILDDLARDFSRNEAKTHKNLPNLDVVNIVDDNGNLLGQIARGNNGWERVP